MHCSFIEMSTERRSLQAAIDALKSIELGPAGQSDTDAPPAIDTDAMSGSLEALLKTLKEEVDANIPRQDQQDPAGSAQAIKRRVHSYAASEEIDRVQNGITLLRLVKIIGESVREYETALSDVQTQVDDVASTIKRRIQLAQDNDKLMDGLHAFVHSKLLALKTSVDQTVGAADEAVQEIQATS